MAAISRAPAGVQVQYRRQPAAVHRLLAVHVDREAAAITCRANQSLAKREANMTARMNGRAGGPQRISLDVMRCLRYDALSVNAVSTSQHTSLCKVAFHAMIRQRMPRCHHDGFKHLPAMLADTFNS